MTYPEAIASLNQLQSARDAAQITADAAAVALADAQSAVNLAQSAVDAFHRYTCYTASTNAQVSYSNIQRPEDSEVSGDTVTVYRDTPPDPIPCEIQTYESGNGVWSDPSSFSLSWTDNGQADQ